MADGLVNMSSQFKGLPMKDLIGGPLTAACEANVQLARATADYINAVGFDEPLPDPNNAGEFLPAKPRYQDFQLDRASQDADGKQVTEEVHMKVPMLAIVPIPNLQVDKVDVTFDMEVSSSTSSKTSSDSEASFKGKAKYGFGFFSVSVEVAGKTSSHKENTRSSDNSAKYHVQVLATNHGTPEGLARIIDIYAEAAAKPSKVLQYPNNADGDKDETATPKLNPGNASVATVTP